MFGSKLDFSKPYVQKWALQTGNLFLADLAGTAAETVAIANIKQFEKAFPTTTDFIVDTLNVPMTYFQTPIEWGLKYTKTIEGEDYYEKRQKKTPEERARSYAEGVFRYGGAWAIGWGATLGSAKMLRTVNGAPHIPCKIWFQDSMMHMGLIALMNTPMLTPTVDKAKQVIKAVAHTLGADEEKAEDISRLAVVSGIPNYTVFGIISNKLYNQNKLRALSKELNISSAISHIV